MAHKIRPNSCGCRSHFLLLLVLPLPPFLSPIQFLYTTSILKWCGAPYPYKWSTNTNTLISFFLSLSLSRSEATSVNVEAAWTVMVWPNAINFIGARQGWNVRNNVDIDKSYWHLYDNNDIINNKWSAYFTLFGVVVCYTSINQHLNLNGTKR